MGPPRTQSRAQSSSGFVAETLLPSAYAAGAASPMYAPRMYIDDGRMPGLERHEFAPLRMVQCYNAARHL